MSSGVLLDLVFKYFHSPFYTLNTYPRDQICSFPIILAWTSITRILILLFDEPLVHHLAGWLRSLIADYGVPLMVLVWTAVSYIPAGSVPEGIPRRLLSPNPWSPGAYENWTVIRARSYF